MRKIPLAMSMALLTTACGSSGGEQAVEPIVASETAPTTEASTVNINRYCDIARAATAAGEEFDAAAELTPEVFEAFLTEMDGYFVEALVVAEPAVAADLAMQAEQFGLLSDAAEAVDYDIFSMLDAVTEISDDPKYDSSDEAVEVYDEKTCGIIPEPDEPADESGAGVDLADVDPTSMSVEEAQVFVDLIQSDAGLELFLAQVPGMSKDQGRCFVTTLTAEQLILLGQLGSVPDEEDFDLAEFAPIRANLQDCDIPMSVFFE